MTVPIHDTIHTKWLISSCDSGCLNSTFSSFMVIINVKVNFTSCMRRTIDQSDFQPFKTKAMSIQKCFKLI